MKKENLKRMPGAYVRAVNKPGTAEISVFVSQDGDPRKERNIAIGLEPAQARQIVRDYQAKGCAIYENFISALWKIADQERENPQLRMMRL